MDTNRNMVRCTYVEYMYNMEGDTIIKNTKELGVVT